MFGTTPYTDTRSAQRYQALVSAQGYYAETLPRNAAASTALLVTGEIYYVSIGLLAGDVVTNILTLCNTLGSGFSGINMKAGLYAKGNGAQLAVTGDISAAHGSTGPKTNALTAPYTVLTTDAYWLAILAIATTPPTLTRGTPASPVYNGAFTGAAMGSLGVQLAQTDLPSPNATVAYATGAAFGLWMGVN